MDYGKLTDHNGKTVDFSNVILIMTTNAGARRAGQAPDRLRPDGARGRRRGGDQADVRAGVPQPPRCCDPLRRALTGGHRARGRQVHHSAWRSNSPIATYRHRAEPGRAHLARREGLRSHLWRPAAGKADPGGNQEADGRRAAVRQAGEGRARGRLASRTASSPSASPRPMRPAAGAAAVPAGAVGPASAPACPNTRPDRLHSRAVPIPFLTGLRVLDLSQYIPGPYGTLILADLGADVIKVEPPGGEPHAGRRDPRMRSGVSVWYRMVNGGKTVVEIDLKSAARQARLSRPGGTVRRLSSNPTGRACSTASASAMRRYTK